MNIDGVSLTNGALERMSDEELLMFHKELEKKNDFLQKENRVFETYLTRVNPQINLADIYDEAGASGGAGDGPGARDGRRDDDGHGGARREERLKKKRGEKYTKEAEKPLLLTAEQKAEVANRELEELKDEIERDRNEWEKVIDNLKAEMEETEIHVSEIKKAMYEFKRDIVQQAQNPRTGKIIAERVVRYFEDRLRAKDATIEKVRLKNSTLKVQKNKLQLQLKQKEEMGEVLHAIDFEQLKIENHQYLNKIEERNSELLKLKLTAGNTVQVLNIYKKKLTNITAESEKLKAEIASRRELLGKLEHEMEVVEDDRKKADELNASIRKKMEEYRVPHVMEYVAEKATQQELSKKVRSWERKVEIAEMALFRQKRLWKQIVREAKDRSAWHAAESGEAAKVAA